MNAASPPSQSESFAESTNGLYDVFISYRHVEPDRGWAKWLHAALETYRIPTALTRQKILPPRLTRVFRDEEELAASASLNDRIEQALQQSRTLIIICSPRTPQSLWVNTEVRRFRDLGRHERILALLIEGEPRDSFPQALREIRRKVVDTSGVVSEQIEEVEPLAADVRPRRDESPRHLRRMAKLRLIACILDVRFDDLRQRHQERHARQLVYLSVAGAALALLMTALAVAAVLQWNEAIQQRAAAVYQEGIAKENARKENIARRQAQRELAESCIAQADVYATSNRWAESARAIDDAYTAFGEAGENTFPADLAMWQLRLAAPTPLNLAATPKSFNPRTVAFTPDGQPFGGGAVALSPDGRLAAGRREDQSLAVWDLRTGGIIQELRSAGCFASSAAFSPDGNALLAGCTDGSVRLWELATGKEIRRFTGHTDAVLAVTFVGDGKLAASGSNDTTVRLWQIEQNQPVATLTGHTGAVMSIASAGSLLVSGGGDGDVFLWDLSSQRRRLLGKADAPVTCVALAADGRSVLSVAGAETVLWDVFSGQRERTFQQPKTLASGAAFDPKSVFAKAAFTPDRERILRASGSNAVLQVIRGPAANRTFAGHDDVVEELAFSADGSVALIGARDNRLLLWPVSDDRGSRRLDHHTNVYSVDVARDGSMALTGGGGTVKLWDCFSGQELRSFSIDKGRIIAVALSPDGSSALVGGDDRMLHLIDLLSAKFVEDFVGHEDGINGIAFSPDGRRALSSSKDGRIKLWDIATGKTVCTLPGHATEAIGVAFSPDGQFCISGGDRNLILWDLNTASQIRSFTGHEKRVRAVAFSADGKFVLSGSDDATMRLWEVATGRLVRSYRADPIAVCGVAFSPDGQMLYSGGATKSLRIWDARSDREWRNIKGFEQSVWSVAVSHDGLLCVGGSNEGIALLSDFSGPRRQREIKARLAAAVAKLADSAGDPDSLKVLGEWYALRGVWPWAAEFLQRARDRGADVSPLLIGRSLWQCQDTTGAKVEFLKALEKKEAGETYLKLCIEKFSEANSGGGGK
jgi:WD40 repeat protein